MSATSDNQQDQPALPPPVFTKASRATDVKVRLTWPGLYPGVVFGVVLDLAMSEDADRTRQEYLGQTQADRRDLSPDHNLEMLALLLKDEPEGFGDFPAPLESYEDEAARRKHLTERARFYFGERGQDGNLVMAWFINNAMGTYWSNVLPSEYL